MHPLTIAEIVNATDGILILGDPMMEVGGMKQDQKSPSKNFKWPPEGVSIDSRTISKGDLFFAIKGHRYDGHAFIRDAILKGASVCLISELSQNMDLFLTDFPIFVQVKDTKEALKRCAQIYRKKYGNNIQIISVNGSCGKTTVKEMIFQILKGFAPTVCSPGNYNNEIGCPLSLFYLNPEYKYAIFEIGSSAQGEVKNLSSIVKPDFSLITNITLEHTASFGTLDEIAQGESEVLTEIKHGGIVFLPRDDAYYSFLKDNVPSGSTIISFGFSKESSVYVDHYETLKDGLLLSIVHQDEHRKILNKIEVNLPVFGRLNALNACASVAIALSLKIPTEVIQSGLKLFQPPKMRFNIISLNNGAILVDDSYNSNPGSVRLSLTSFLETFPGKKKTVVLGDMLELGSISIHEHRLLGEFLSTLSLDEIILFGTESKYILEGLKNHMKKISVHFCEDRKDLLDCVQNTIQPNAAILFKASRMLRMDEIIHDIESKNGHSKTSLGSVR